MKRRRCAIIIGISCLVGIIGFLLNCQYKTHLQKIYLHFLSIKYGKESGDISSTKQINEIADFLLDNLQSHTGITESDNQILQRYYRSWVISSKSVTELIDSIERSNIAASIRSGQLINDAHAIDSDSLWDYILELYKLRSSSPICRVIEKENFLEFVVPYRVDNESKNLNWRKSERSFLEDYKDYVEKSSAIKIRDIANKAMKRWNKKTFKWTDGLPHWGSIGVKQMTIKGGNCKDFGIGACYLMRYLGIPAGLDMLFAREGESSSHQWPFIIDENGASYYATQDIPLWNPCREMDLPATKIYRHTFSERQVFNFTGLGIEDIHPRFRNNHLKDVTKEYREVYDISVPITRELSMKSDIVYLCNATREKWMPVGVGKVENGLAKFKDVASSEIACIISYWDGKAILPLSRPFTIDLDGTIRYFKYSNNYVESHIYCKYPLSAQNGDVVDRIVGGRIEGSNTTDFRDAELIYEIKEAPIRKITKVNVRPKGAYRYIRYIGADSTYCNIAELELFEKEGDENISIGCRVFGTPGDKSGKGTHEYVNVFDGDLYTSFDYKNPSGGWSAVDLKYQRMLTAVAYSPRNRDNYIRKEDLYEMFYWDDKNNEWNSLGKKVADSDELIYNIPEGSLLFLKNHTRGINERVFEYDKKEGVQIFH